MKLPYPLAKQKKVYQVGTKLLNKITSYENNSTSEKFVVLVGYGKIGKLYDRMLLDIGVRLVQVSEKERYCLSNIIQVYSTIDPLWIVATPTDSHYFIAMQIWKTNPNARILIEKPLCSEYEIDFFRKSEGRYPVACSDIYGQSRIIDLLYRKIRNEKIIRLEINMSKNRLADQDKGRFTDRDLGILGYEWFHMLSIAKKLGLTLNKQSMSSSPTISYGLGLKETLTLNIISENVVLRSSIEGKIDIDPNFEKMLYRLYPKHTHSFFSLGKIPYGSLFNLRYIDVHLSSGKRLLVLFEFDYQSTDYKNRHCFIEYTSNFEIVSYHEVHTNMLKEFVQFVLQRKFPPISHSVEVMDSIYEIRRQLF